MDKQSRVRKNIEDAFLSATNQFSNEIPHNIADNAIFIEDDFELISNLHLFSSKDLPHVLSEILIDFIDNPKRDNLEGLVSFLNVLFEESQSQINATRRLLGDDVAEKALNDADEIRRAQRESISEITNKQAKAIYEWLLLAREWEVLDYCLPDLEAAIKYWNSRSS